MYYNNSDVSVMTASYELQHFSHYQTSNRGDPVLRPSPTYRRPCDSTKHTAHALCNPGLSEKFSGIACAQDSVGFIAKILYESAATRQPFLQTAMFWTPHKGPGPNCCELTYL